MLIRVYTAFALLGSPILHVSVHVNLIYLTAITIIKEAEERGPWMEKIAPLLFFLFLSANLHSLWLITVAVADRKLDMFSPPQTRESWVQMSPVLWMSAIFVILCCVYTATS
jgi:hypothetical protein